MRTPLTVVGVHLPALALDHLQGLAHAHEVLAHEVVQHDGGTARDAGLAVHEHVGGAAGALDEVEGVIEVGRDVVVVAVVGVDHEVRAVQRVLRGGADGQHRADLVLLEQLHVVCGVVLVVL